MKKEIEKCKKAIEILKENGFNVQIDGSKLIITFDVETKEAKPLIQELEQEIDKEITKLKI